jgi:hypothetical protein
MALTPALQSTSTLAAPKRSTLPTPPPSKNHKKPKKSLGPVTVKYVPKGWPVRLVVPKMAVNAPVEDVNMRDPKDAHAPFKWGDVAWHFTGPRPGEAGHAAIFGHLDSYCCPAVFYHLRYLVPGDKIWVMYPNKQPVIFKVIWLHDYLNTQVPLKWMFAVKGQRALILATCSGDFHRDGTGYDHKLVVFSRLILPNGKLG